VDGNVIGKIGKGFMVLIGIEDEDTQAVADKMIHKMTGLRIFTDEEDKMNLSLRDVGGELLLISQFTLYADCKKGNRPSFIKAGKPDMAEKLYQYIIEKCREEIEVVEKGEFGADMKVELLNDGPVTIILDSHEILSSQKKEQV
jgi:D-tyrosyl-tRNA(Tyr) deacylase